MNMIWLHCSLYQAPTTLSDNLIDDLLPPFLKRPDQHTPPPLWAKDQMIHDQV
jgi:hypothetical protein